MSYTDEDPEVIEDLQLRARTMRERSGNREAQYTAPVFVSEWACRACRELVPITADAMENWQRFNRMLAARNEAAIRTSEIVFCDRCRVEFRRTAPERRRGQVERMRPVIIKLKRSSNPEEEREAIKQLETYGHPDVNGLVAAIRARLESKGRTPDRGGA
jgi:hypothetical protein